MNTTHEANPDRALATRMSRHRAMSIASDNNQADPDWGYFSVPSIPSKPESAWIVLVRDETGYLVGYL